MIALPYVFDTTGLWQQIVKLAFTIAGVLLLGVLGGLATGQFGGAIGFAVMMALVIVMLRRVRGMPMGAAGTLSELTVETRPVRVLWYSLHVPVGRFSISQFETIAVVEHVVFPRVGDRGANTWSVRLVGKRGVPSIEVANRDIDEALAIGETLGRLLMLSPADRRAGRPGPAPHRLAIRALWQTCEVSHAHV